MRDVAGLCGAGSNENERMAGQMREIGTAVEPFRSLACFSGAVFAAGCLQQLRVRGKLR